MCTLMKAIALRLEAIASKLEAIAMRNKQKEHEERSNIVGQAVQARIRASRPGLLALHFGIERSHVHHHNPLLQCCSTGRGL